MAFGIAISGHVRREVALQPGLVVPMRAGWIARPDAAGLNDRYSDRIGIAANLAVEHVPHGQNRLERIALGAAGR
jgi:hypothetical protein